MNVFRRRRASLVAILGWVVLSGCAQTFDATTLGVEATMAEPVSAGVVGEPFSISKKSIYLVAGMIHASRPALDDVLSAQATSTQRVANLRIKVRSRFSDVLISILTVGMVVPRTVTFEGVVIR